MTADRTNPMGALQEVTERLFEEFDFEEALRVFVLGSTELANRISERMTVFVRRALEWDPDEAAKYDVVVIDDAFVDSSFLDHVHKTAPDLPVLVLSNAFNHPGVMVISRRAQFGRIRHHLLGLVVAARQPKIRWIDRERILWERVYGRSHGVRGAKVDSVRDALLLNLPGFSLIPCDSTSIAKLLKAPSEVSTLNPIFLSSDLIPDEVQVAMEAHGWKYALDVRLAEFAIKKPDYIHMACPCGFENATALGIVRTVRNTCDRHDIGLILTDVQSRAITTFGDLNVYRSNWLALGGPSPG